MTADLVLNKIRKLLKLAGNNSSPEEAASAAAMAQELLDRHQLNTAMLALDEAAPVETLDEPIQDFTDSPLDVGTSSQLQRWRGYLAMTIGKFNACKIWRSRANLMIIGRPSDAETVRYLFSWLAREVEQLTTQHGRGQGMTWRNNFRLGVVDTITRKLEEQHAQFTQTVRAEVANNSQALVRVNTALARIEQRAQSVEKWTAANRKLRKGTTSHTRYDSGARSAGRAAGERINLTTKPGLTSGARGFLR